MQYLHNDENVCSIYTHNHIKRRGFTAMNYYGIVTTDALRIGEAMWIELMYPVIVFLFMVSSIVLVFLAWFFWRHRVGELWGLFDRVSNRVLFWCMDRVLGEHEEERQ